MSDERTGRQRTAGDGRESPRPPLVRVATRGPADHSRTSPWMRFDLLQIAAWLLGLVLVVLGLVAVARAGLDELGLFEPVVEVARLPATPLLALVWLLVGVLLLAGGTGEVDERGLRIGGIVLGIVGTVWIIEPGAFEPYLGVQAQSGVVLLAFGVALTGTSYVPPLSVARPGVAIPRLPRTR